MRNDRLNKRKNQGQLDGEKPESFNILREINVKEAFPTFPHPSTHLFETFRVAFAKIVGVVVSEIINF